MLTEGYHDVPAGMIAAVVTTLEMRAPAALRPVPDPDGVQLVRHTAPSLDWYRDLYTRVGGTNWLWFSRLTMDDADLSAILTDPKVEIYAAEVNGRAEGLLELDLREDGQCELAFFGLTSAMIGKGAGRWLMNHAIDLAWKHDLSRFHVHTCTFDHPSALDFYRRSGFTPVSRQIEVARDPRLAGIFDRSAAPHIPVID